MSDLNEKDSGNDVVELAKVWDNLSENMQILLAKAIAGGEFAEGTKAMISEIGKFDDNFYEHIGKNMMNFNKYIQECINKIKEIDNNLVNLKKEKEMIYSPEIRGTHINQLTNKETDNNNHTEKLFAWFSNPQNNLKEDLTITPSDELTPLSNSSMLPKKISDEVLKYSDNEQETES